MNEPDLLLLYLGWLVVFALAVVVGYSGITDHLGRKRK